MNRRDFAGTFNINPIQHNTLGEIRGGIGDITIRPEQSVVFRGVISSGITIRASEKLKKKFAAIEVPREELIQNAEKEKPIEKTEPTEVRPQAIVSKEPDEDSDDQLWHFLCKSFHLAGALINVVLDTYQVCSFT